MSAEFIAILSVGATLVGVVAAFGALILTSITRTEACINRRIDDVVTDTKAEFAASEARSNARFAEMQASTSKGFDDVNEQFRVMQARTDAGFADVNEQLRTTNDRMTSVERQQARLGGLLDGLREALFQRVQQ